MFCCKKFYEGKVKIFYEGFEVGMFVQYFKDDVMVFNGEKYVIFEGKGVFNNCIFEYIFFGFQWIGINMYFIKCLNMCE